MAPMGTQERDLADPVVESEAIAEAPTSNAPPVEAQWSSPGGPPARHRLTFNRLVLGVLILAIILSGVVLSRLLARTAPGMDIQLFVVNRRSFPIILKEKGELKAATSIDVRSEVEGSATIIYLIPEGTRVKEGELLIELASDGLEEKTRDAESKEANANADYEMAVKTRDILRDENASKIRKAQLALRLANLTQQKYIEGDKKAYEQEATLAVDKAHMILQREQQDLKDAQELFKQDFITRVELKDAEFNAYAADLDVKKAELALRVLKEYTIPMGLEATKSAVAEAEKEFDRERKAAEASESKATADVEAKKSDMEIAREKLVKLREQKAKSRVVAPSAGLVVYAREGYWRSEPSIETGVRVHERQMLIQLPDTSKMKVEVRVHEAQIERLQVGMPASVSVEGFSNRTFTGKVSKIAVMADSQNMFLNPNLREYKTDILLEGEFHDELKPNVTARVEIQIAQLDNVLAVPVQALFAKSGKFYVFLDEKGVTRSVPVHPGLSSAEYVEIKTGLHENQAVRLAVTDDMSLMLPDEVGETESTEGDKNARERAKAKPVHPLPANAEAPHRAENAKPENRKAEERKLEQPTPAAEKAQPEERRPERRPVTTREAR